MFEKRIIIGGLPRSGSTLLRFILDSSEEIISGPETRFFLEPLYRHQSVTDRTVRYMTEKLNLSAEVLSDAIHRASNIFEAYDYIMLKYMEYANEHKKSWAEKTPMNCFHYPRLALENEEAYFISTVRNGLDVVTSKIESLSNDYWCPVLRYIESMRCIYGFEHPRHIIVKYEEMVTDPEGTLKRVFDFLGLAFNRRVLENFNKESKTRDFSKVHQPKLVHGIQPTWVERYKLPEHAEKVKEFVENEQAMYWFRHSGYSL